MKRALLISGLALCACSSGSKSDGGTGGGGGNEEVLFDVSGHAAIFPEGIGVSMDAGVTPSVAGLTLRVEEPLKVALNPNDPLGVFSTTTLDATGAFSATMVSDQLVNLGIAAGVVDDGGTRAVRSATVIWDVAFEQKKPDKNITGAKAWVLPKALHDRLTAAVTEAAIMGFTSNQKRTLVEAGCILGRVVDAMGNPVAGVTVTSTTSSLNPKFVYPNADLSGTGASTAANGLFVFVHDGTDNVAQFSFNVMGATGYRQRSAGSAKNACLVMTVYPGTTAPP